MHRKAHCCIKRLKGYSMIKCTQAGKTRGTPQQQCIVINSYIHFQNLVLQVKCCHFHRIFRLKKSSMTPPNLNPHNQKRYFLPTSEKIGRVSLRKINFSMLPIRFVIPPRRKDKALHLKNHHSFTYFCFLQDWINQAQYF